MGFFNFMGRNVFQSTLPVWGVTDKQRANLKTSYISIHTPRVGSDHFCARLGYTERISIHTPRVGSDLELYERKDMG